MTNIYQQIWNADQQGNGIAALRPGEETNSDLGYVIVDERKENVGDDFKVLKEVLIPENKMHTYRLCKKLFDNYALARAAREIVRPEEEQEELDFINAIVDTAPIQVAKSYMESSLNLQISDNLLAAMIKETWFELGRAGSQHQASGFEHVFIGEQSSKSSKVGGYHFWFKYYLDDAGQISADDEGIDRIEYKGTRYQGASSPEEGLLIPEVVTLSLVWTAPAGDNPANLQSLELKKPIGGFFVGCSPECLIALGLVRCRTNAGKITVINNAEYQLDLHRLDAKPNAIRTFFPRFRRAELDDIIITNSDNSSTPSTPAATPALNLEADDDKKNIGSFAIIAAMVNPPAPEGGREFIQLINCTSAVASLQGWQIIAPNGSSFTLAEQGLHPGDIFKFQIPAQQGVLRNKAGEITLKSADGTIEKKYSYSSEQAKNEGSVIIF
ncbi:hypothetical protein [Agaribacterium haliotis]|uniref:hypothetical protein n=1 Tax=Agaribacterium haliotis TaxID=2013869 RepID=UPI001177693B|nr:hypothetical protein [Agaribacterium haliotis]